MCVFCICSTKLPMSPDFLLCRALVYDIWIWLHDRRPDALPGPQLTQLLLHGLSDEALPIRTKVLEFWHHETRLPLEAGPRLTRLFEALAARALGQ